MIKNPLGHIRDRFEENFASVWKLLSDTDHFLSRTPLFDQYENRIRLWRYQLQIYRNDTDRIGEIKKEIVVLRKELRQGGYNLRLGQYTVEFQGFRSDDAPRFGFRRAVLIEINRKVYLLCGSENHNELKYYLGGRLTSSGISYNRDFHSIWFTWDNRLLIISGADSETKEDFEDLRKDVERNEFIYIDAFRGK